MRILAICLLLVPSLVADQRKLTSRERIEILRGLAQPRNRVAAEDSRDRNRVGIPVHGSERILGAVTRSPQPWVAQGLPHIRERVGGRGSVSALSLDNNWIETIGIRGEANQTLHNTDSVLYLRALGSFKAQRRIY